VTAYRYTAEEIEKETALLRKQLEAEGVELQQTKCDSLASVPLHAAGLGGQR
jgi:hypothetical protein